MNPGNWTTDIAGGSKFGYTLLSGILLSNLMAILLQLLCVRLGVATGKDLAQACRDYFSPRVSFVLWVLCEIAIAACDLAELLGSALPLAHAKRVRASTLIWLTFNLGRLYHRTGCPGIAVFTR